MYIPRFRTKQILERFDFELIDLEPYKVKFDNLVTVCTHEEQQILEQWNIKFTDIIVLNNSDCTVLGWNVPPEPKFRLLSIIDNSEFGLLVDMADQITEVVDPLELLQRG